VGVNAKAKSAILETVHHFRKIEGDRPGGKRGLQKETEREKRGGNLQDSRKKTTFLAPAVRTIDLVLGLRECKEKDGSGKTWNSVPRKGEETELPSNEKASKGRPGDLLPRGRSGDV